MFASGLVSANAVFGTETLIGAGDKDQVLARYSDAGDLDWIVSGGGPGIDAGSAVVALGNGHALFAGSFQGSATFSGTTVTAGGDSDVLLVECDATGAAINITHWGMEGDNTGYGLAQGPDGAVYLAGQFEGGMVIGDTVIGSSGGRDAFVHQVCEGVVGITEAVLDPSLLLSPNPVAADQPWTITVKGSQGPSSVTVSDAQGRRIFGQRFTTEQCTCTVEGLARGMYVVHLLNGQGGSSAQRLIVE